MTTNTTHNLFDLSGFNANRASAENIRRSAELARSEYLAAKFKKVKTRIGAAYRSASELFSFAQQQNQAARL